MPIFSDFIARFRVEDQGVSSSADRIAASMGNVSGAAAQQAAELDNLAGASAAVADIQGNRLTRSLRQLDSSIKDLDRSVEESLSSFQRFVNIGVDTAAAIGTIIAVARGTVATRNAIEKLNPSIASLNRNLTDSVKVGAEWTADLANQALRFQAVDESVQRAAARGLKGWQTQAKLAAEAAEELSRMTGLSLDQLRKLDSNNLSLIRGLESVRQQTEQVGSTIAKTLVDGLRDASKQVADLGRTLTSQGKSIVDTLERIDKAVQQVTQGIKRFSQASSEVAKRVRSLGGRLLVLVRNFGSISTYGLPLIARITKMGFEASTTARQIENLTKFFDSNAQVTGQLAQAYRGSSSSLEELDANMRAVANVQSALRDGSTQYDAALQGLNINVDKFKRLGLAQALNLIHKQVQDSNRSLFDQEQLLNDLGIEYQDVIREADAATAQFSADTQIYTTQMRDDWNAVVGAVTDVVNKITGEASGALDEFAVGVANFYGRIRQGSRDGETSVFSYRGAITTARTETEKMVDTTISAATAMVDYGTAAQITAGYLNDVTIAFDEMRTRGAIDPVQFFQGFQSSPSAGQQRVVGDEFGLSGATGTTLLSQINQALFRSFGSGSNVTASTADADARFSLALAQQTDAFTEALERNDFAAAERANNALLSQRLIAASQELTQGEQLYATYQAQQAFEDGQDRITKAIDDLADQEAAEALEAQETLDRIAFGVSSSDQRLAGAIRQYVQTSGTEVQQQVLEDYEQSGLQTFIAQGIGLLNQFTSGAITGEQYTAGIDQLSVLGTDASTLAALGIGEDLLQTWLPTIQPVEVDVPVDVNVSVNVDEAALSDLITVTVQNGIESGEITTTQATQLVTV